MALILLVCSYFEPDTAKLGSEDYREREYWSARYENTLSALLLPRTQSDDPEVRLRVARIRVKARWFDTVYWERVTMSRDLDLWFDRYVVNGESRLLTLRETYETMRRDSDWARRYMMVAEGRYFLPAWLSGIALPNEFDQFLAHRMVYRYKLTRWPVAHKTR